MEETATQHVHSIQGRDPVRLKKRPKPDKTNIASRTHSQHLIYRKIGRNTEMESMTKLKETCTFITIYHTYSSVSVIISSQ